MNIQQQKTGNNSPKFVFLYLLSLMGLIFTALPVGMVIFQIINKYIKDPIGPFGQTYSSDLLRFAIAALIVATPLFFLISRKIYQYLFKGILDQESDARKWLTYFILLVSALTMLGWFIGTINNYLGGELTIKFVLKALASIGIAAVVFSFYLYDIKREEVVGQKNKVIKIYFWGSLVLIMVIFVSAFLIVESPKQARQRKLDNAILENFNLIDSGLNNYYEKNKKLPDSLQELRTDVLFITEQNTIDPITGQSYEYKLLGDRRYQLCATFRTSNVDSETDMMSQYYREQWPHKTGFQCLEQIIRIVNGMEISD